MEHPSGNTHSVRFTGSGSEYFGIWSVNWLLTIVTLGIYSPWAKVRRLKYFHQSTELAGAGFDYHGSPMAILKGRLIGLLLLILVSLVPFAGLLFLPVLPILLRSSMRFRLQNTSYRGLRFRFSGGLGGAYAVFLIGWLLTVFSFGLLAPFFHQRLKRYQHAQAWYGRAGFSFTAGVGSFYGIYLRTVLLAVAGLVISGVLAGVAGLSMDAFGQLMATPDGGQVDPAQIFRILLPLLAIGVLVNLVLLVLIWPYFMARIQNLTWNGTQLGGHVLCSQLRARRLAWVMASNLVLVLLTAGLFSPWASVRLARCRLEAVSLQATAALDDFLAAQQAAEGATGEETAEWFDLDFGL